MTHEAGLAAARSAIQRFSGDADRWTIAEAGIDAYRAAAKPEQGVGELDGAQYEAVHRAAIDAYERATPPDARYSATALRKAVDAALALREAFTPEGQSILSALATPSPVAVGAEPTEAMINAGFAEWMDTRPRYMPKLDLHARIGRVCRAMLRASHSDTVGPEAGAGG